MSNNIISKIITESNYQLEQFTYQEIENVEKLLSKKQDKKGNEVYYINCQIRNKSIDKGRIDSSIISI